MSQNTMTRKMRSLARKLGLRPGQPASPLHPAEMNPAEQDIDLYWDPHMAELLETWGEGTTWNEIQLLMVNCAGKVLDIACGTGKTMELLKPFPSLQLYGCDISDLLIQKAIDRGVAQDRLEICDATKTDYADNFFDYSYSIGSLEHFTNEGILQFIAEAHRITKSNSFHMVPVSRSGKDEGWIKPMQSYHNNSIDWWLDKYRSAYKTVHVLDSSWCDAISIGKWFICMREEKQTL